MKKMIARILIVSFLISTSACGNGSVKSSFPESAGYLPTKIEKISEGGIVPEGHEAKTQIEESKYPMESLWGTWVRKDYDEDDDENKEMPDHTITIPYNSMVYDDIVDEYTLDLFPQEFQFYPTGHNSAELLQLRRLSTSVDDEVSQSEDLEGFSDGTPVEKAMDALMLGHGTMTFPVASATENGKETEAFWDEISRAVAYRTSGTILTVGITDIDQTMMFLNGSIDTDTDEVSINEIDYEITWTGTDLTLSFDGQSVTYVPEFVKNGGTGLIEEASYLDGYEPIGGIIGVSISSDARIMRDVHEGYEIMGLEFKNDGTVVIDGTKYNYLRSDESLTLFDDEKCTVYSHYKRANYSENNHVSESICVGDRKIELDPDELSVELFLKNGINCDLDLTQMVRSGEVTPEFSFYVEDSVLPAKAVNPYAEAVPLGMCSIAYFRIDEHTGEFNKGDGTSIGVTNIEDVEFYYEGAYEKKPGSLRYKAHPDISSLFIRYYEDRLSSKGDMILDLYDDTEVIYEFDENNILKDILIERPALLYNGLQDNVDRAQLVDMTAATMTGVIQTRDTVLDSLKDSFSKANANVSINESTGEIVMDNSVLFGYDSAELSSEGKKYLDTLMTTYASVVLSDEFLDSIAEIRFEGHTDSTGSFDYNLDLSQKRADAVRDYCMNESKLSDVEKSRLKEKAKSIGYSFSDPVYGENGEEDADASRRVAIKFFVEVEEKAESDSELQELKKTENTQLETAGKELTSLDFIVKYNGKSVDTLGEMDSGNLWSFDGDDDVTTARGISLGDTMQKVYDEYGDAGVTLLSQDKIFEGTGIEDELKAKSDYYVFYVHNNNAVFFFMKAEDDNVNMSNQVTCIAFFKGDD